MADTDKVNNNTKDNAEDNDNDGMATQQTLNAKTKRGMNTGASSSSKRAAAASSSSAAIPGGESGYEPWYPNNIATDSSVKRFITRFFQVSDDPDRNDEWADCFDENATVMMGNDVAKGKEGRSSPGPTRYAYGYYLVSSSPDMF